MTKQAWWWTAMLGSVAGLGLGVGPAGAEPRNATGQCVAETASAASGPPPGIAHGEPVPGTIFPFTCPPPPGAD